MKEKYRCWQCNLFPIKLKSGILPAIWCLQLRLQNCEWLPPIERTFWRASLKVLTWTSPHFWSSELRLSSLSLRHSCIDRVFKVWDFVRMINDLYRLIQMRESTHVRNAVSYEQTEVWRTINHDFSSDFKQELATVCWGKLFMSVLYHRSYLLNTPHVWFFPRQIRYRIRMLEAWFHRERC